MVTLEIPCGKSLLENPSVLAVLFIDLAFRLLNLAYNLLIKVQTYVSEKVSKPPRSKPRILVVTPEITYLPEGMGNLAQRLSPTSKIAVSMRQTFGMNAISSALLTTMKRRARLTLSTFSPPESSPLIMSTR